jgi:hypothetical protein
MHPVVLNHKIRSKQTTIEHNVIKCSHSYMFRPYRAIIRLTFSTYQKKYNYCIVEVRFSKLEIFQHSICVLSPYLLKVQKPTFIGILELRVC